MRVINIRTREVIFDQVTIDNGIERDVDLSTDYKCDECSTETREVFHVREDIVA